MVGFCRNPHSLSRRALGDDDAIILLGGIFSGYFTATESAAVARFYATIIEAFVYLELSLADFRHVAIKTTTLLGTLFPVLALALGLNKFLVAEGLPDLLAQWLTANVHTTFEFLMGLIVIVLLIVTWVPRLSLVLIR